MSDKILVATDSGAIAYIDEDGEEQRAVIHKGVTRVHPDHPLVKGNEELFKPLDLHFNVRTARKEPVRPPKQG